MQSNAVRRNSRVPGTARSLRQSLQAKTAEAPMCRVEKLMLATA